MSKESPIVDDPGTCRWCQTAPRESCTRDSCTRDSCPRRQLHKEPAAQEPAAQEPAAQETAAILGKSLIEQGWLRSPRFCTRCPAASLRPPRVKDARIGCTSEKMISKTGSPASLTASYANDLANPMPAMTRAQGRDSACANDGVGVDRRVQHGRRGEVVIGRRLSGSSR